jgi:hypothetical protein
VNGRFMRVAWFWSRASFPRRRASYVGIVILLAVLGGVAMASVSGARRTESSYNTFLASTNPSDMKRIVERISCWARWIAAATPRPVFG